MEVNQINWKEKLANLFWKVKIGERAEGLRQSRKRFDNVESLTRETRRYLMGIKNSGASDDDMRIGDDNSTTTHYHQPGSSSWTKAAIGIGLIATGAGAGWGSSLLINALNKKTQSLPMTAPSQPTSDTVFEWSLPEKNK